MSPLTSPSSPAVSSTQPARHLERSDLAPPDPLAPVDTFIHRHIGPDDGEIAAMLARLGFRTLDELTAAAIPGAIRTARPLDVGAPRGEHELLQELAEIAGRNQIFRSFIGMGYAETITPPVIQRNVLEDPGWYTQYTPYQSEIAQGRLEALLTFQTMVSDLTGLPVAGASLLDEATAAAEAMTMCRGSGQEQGARRFLISPHCHPQTIAVVQGRARRQGLTAVVADPATASLDGAFGVLLQYPATDGAILDERAVVARAHAAGAKVVVAADILALALLAPPGEWGADVAVGSAQRFGVPLGFGGPHAAYLATRPEHVRRMPGRLVGVSRDARGRPALRLAIQTREQHIRRDRATSNICTAQVLLAIMSAMYAVYHGPDGLRRIAHRVHALTRALATGLERLGHRRGPARPETPFFDTLRVRPTGVDAAEIHRRAAARRMNFRRYDDGTVGIALDETATREDVRAILEIFAGRSVEFEPERFAASGPTPLGGPLERRSAYLEHEVFNTHHSETEMLRYLTRLKGRDLSLAQSMIPLGSCTMKLNATSEMLPVTWPAFARMHPFAPPEQAEGYARLFRDLERWLAEITGFAAVSLQPNAGSQGEYAGLAVIRALHESRGDEGRDVCLVPVSAHGTNPASAVAAGFRVVPVACDDRGNIDLADLRTQADAHASALGALMITYPSTHGVFEETVREVCRIVRERGGRVYLDGANMNAMVGLVRPAELGADVCHLNLHKTFCIPHGGGGPGMGPIAVTAELAPFLPGHPVAPPASAGARAIEPISEAPYGSASILPITWVYVALMGGAGLRRATQVAILSANYMAKRLAEHYGVVYTGPNGLVAHEFILDFRPFDRSAGVKVDDVAKRLMDYGFHAPTMSWPVPGTLMIEPTESEPKAELDRLCDALIAIRAEIRAIEEGRADRADNALKHAPHTIEMVAADDWAHAYPREQAAFPAPWLRDHKFWPPVARIDNPYGDRNLVCTCAGVESYAAAARG
jgi:glycine dehydrogenase